MSIIILQMSNGANVSNPIVTIYSWEREWVRIPANESNILIVLLKRKSAKNFRNMLNKLYGVFFFQK